MKRLIIAPCPKRTGTAPGKAGIGSLVLATFLWAIVLNLGVWDYYILRFPPSNIPKPYRALYHEMLAPVVKITTWQGRGSGVIISSEAGNTYVLTAAHVVGDESTVTVGIYEYEYELPVATVEWATVVITDTYKDLALLRLNPSNLRSDSGVPTHSGRVRSARLAPRDYTPYLFTEVYAVGCSLGLNPRPSEGIITSIEYRALSSQGNVPQSSVLTTHYWEISAPILPGNSGGGVFLKDTHELIGITVWIRTCYGQLVTTMAGVIPIHEIYEFLDKTPGVNCEEHKRPGLTVGQAGVPSAQSGQGARRANTTMKGGEKSCHKR